MNVITAALVGDKVILADGSLGQRGHLTLFQQACKGGLFPAAQEMGPDIEKAGLAWLRVGHGSHFAYKDVVVLGQFRTNLGKELLVMHHEVNPRIENLGIVIAKDHGLERRTFLKHKLETGRKGFTLFGLDRKLFAKSFDCVLDPPRVEQVQGRLLVGSKSARNGQKPQLMVQQNFIQSHERRNWTARQLAFFGSNVSQSCIKCIHLFKI